MKRINRSLPVSVPLLILVMGAWVSFGGLGGSCGAPPATPEQGTRFEDLRATAPGAGRWDESPSAGSPRSIGDGASAGLGTQSDRSDLRATAPGGQAAGQGSQAPSGLGTPQATGTSDAFRNAAKGLDKQRSGAQQAPGIAGTVERKPRRSVTVAPSAPTRSAGPGSTASSSANVESPDAGAGLFGPSETEQDSPAPQEQGSAPTGNPNDATPEQREAAQSPAQDSALDPGLDPAGEWPVVAEMEWVVGPRRSVVLHGTLPVGPEFRELSPAKTPLACRWKGTAVQPTPAQVMVVTRHPDGRPAVVELQVPMSVPANVRAGSRQRLAVLLGEFECPPKWAGAWSDETPKPFLTTTDVFGNRYRFDLGEGPSRIDLRTLQSGPASRQWRVAGAFAPDRLSGEGDPLPHLMGVQAYVTDWARGQTVSLDLRVHNGLTAGSGPRRALNAPLGTIYWKSLDLHLPPGWDEPSTRG